MQIGKFKKKIFIAFLLSSFLSLANAQSADGWYKVFVGKMGNNTARLHLHKSGKNFNGYLWFIENQWPMQLFTLNWSNYTDSLKMSARNGPVSIIISGVLKDHVYRGMSEMKDGNGVPVLGPFELELTKEKTFTPFNYYYSEGFAKLPPQLKNESECIYKVAAIWPIGNNNMEQAYKNEILNMFEIKTPADEIGRWMIDEKNNYTANWKVQHSKLTPKEASGMGLGLSLQEENLVMIMYEDEKYITIANFKYGYTGGAHGSYRTNLASFEKSTGKKVLLPDLISADGSRVLSEILEKVARWQYGIKNNSPLNQNGFLVKKIVPSQNFYITGHGIGFLYEPYSIKPFSDGQVNLLIPFNLLKNYIQPNIQSK